MKEISLKTWNVGMESKSMLMETFIWEISQQIKNMEKGSSTGLAFHLQ